MLYTPTTKKALKRNLKYAEAIKVLSMRGEKIARVTIYTKSIIATFCNLMGYGLILTGALGALNGAVLPGVMLLIIGIALSILAGYISLIQSDTKAAIAAYKIYPRAKTLKYIQKLNYEAVREIEEYLLF